MTMTTQERALLRCMSNDLRGLNFEPADGLEGFILRDAATGKAMFTAYVAAEGFSAYVAVDDGRGYDLADERPLAVRAPLFAAVAKIKASHRQTCPEAYTVAMERDEAYRAGHWN